MKPKSVVHPMPGIVHIGDETQDNLSHPIQLGASAVKCWNPRENFTAPKKSGAGKCADPMEPTLRFHIPTKLVEARTHTEDHDNSSPLPDWDR